MTTDLIDRYTYEVGQHLPRRMRADVQMELNSSLQDTLSERGGDTPNEESVVALLQELGPPEEVAARYQPEQVLIGPSLFPTYKLFTVIAFGFVTLVFGVGVSLSLIGNGLSIIGWRGIWDMIMQYVDYILLNLGVVTAVFAVLERLGAGQAKKETIWDPRSLPAITDPDRINRGGMIVSILFTAAAIIVFNFFPQWVGVIGFHDGSPGIIPMLAPEFQTHIPWLTAVWALEIGLNWIVLRQGRWQTATRWAEVVFYLAGILVALRILRSDAITIIPILTSLVKAGLGVVLVIVVWELLGKLYRLIYSPQTTLKASQNT